MAEDITERIWWHGWPCGPLRAGGKEGGSCDVSFRVLWLSCGYCLPFDSAAVDSTEAFLHSICVLCALVQSITQKLNRSVA